MDKAVILDHANYSTVAQGWLKSVGMSRSARLACEVCLANVRLALSGLAYRAGGAPDRR